jgi:hypothetical protein
VEQQEDRNESPRTAPLRKVATGEQKTPAEYRAELKLIGQTQQLDVVAHASILPSQRARSGNAARVAIEYSLAFASVCFAVK